MQPCSQPRYGLIDWPKGTSGESLRAMMERARSSVTVVLNSSSTGSSPAQPSSNGERCSVSNRPCICESAPRSFVIRSRIAFLPDTVYMDSSLSNTHRNVGLLAACQAMLFTNNSTLIAINGLAGLALAPTPSLATLPVTCWVVGGAIATMPASQYMKKVGRQSGLMRGAAIGIVGALICAAAVWEASFWLLCFGALVFGTFNSFGQYYRFVAAEVAPPDFRATAVSLVLAGGLVGGILGPSISRVTIDLVGPKFTGAYLALIAFVLVTIAILSRIRVPDLSAAEQAATGRPLSEIARQPKYIVAVMSGAISYGVMNFLMTSTPIAMRGCGHPYGDAAFVIS